MGKRTTLRVTAAAAKASVATAGVAKAGRHSRGGGDTDREVGKRIRIRRVQIGMSQQELGKALGVSFQQVQKYEKGTNRVSAGRILAIANILGITINFFYDVGGEEQREAESMIAADTQYNLRLLRAYNAIVDLGLRRRLVLLMEGIAGLTA